MLRLLVNRVRLNTKPSGQPYLSAPYLFELCLSLMLLSRILSHTTTPLDQPQHSLPNDIPIPLIICTILD